MAGRWWLGQTGEGGRRPPGRTDAEFWSWSCQKGRVGGPCPRWSGAVAAAWPAAAGDPSLTRSSRLDCLPANGFVLGWKELPSTSHRSMTSICHRRGGGGSWLPERWPRWWKSRCLWAGCAAQVRAGCYGRSHSVAAGASVSVGVSKVERACQGRSLARLRLGQRWWRLWVSSPS